MKLLKWFFSFGEKYRKREKEYHRRSKKFGTAGEIMGLILYTAVPLLSLWGLFSDVHWGLKILCGMGALTIFMAPSELMITGIVALRHRMRMKVQNKVEGAMIGKTAEMISGEELTGEAKEKIDNYQARGTADTYDLVVGICGIVLSIVVVLAFIGLSILFIYARLK